MKKLICVCLYVIVTLCVFTTAVSAGERAVLESGCCGAAGDNVVWTLYKDGELVISGDGEMADFGVYNIPWEEAYGNSIRKVTVENGVTSVGNNAFRGLYYATRFDIADSVLSIGEYAFGWTSFGGFFGDKFYEIVLPENITEIANKAFYQANIDRIVIPEKITVIGKEAFYNCRDLDTVVIPSGITAIDENAFGGCDEIDTVYFRGTREQWDSISFGQGNGYLKNADNIYFDVACHNYDLTVIAPTCMNKGYSEYVCSICGDKYIDENSYTDITAHTTTNGQCDMCEKIIVQTGETVSLSVSSQTDTIIEWSLAENNAEISDISTTTVILGSFFRISSEVEIKGVAVGKNTLTATADGEKIAEFELIILPHTHKYSISSVKEATCTEKGFTTYLCPCGDSYNSDYTALTEHNYIPVVKEATCYEQGFTEYLCGCGKSYISDYTDKLEHECGWITVCEPEVGAEGMEVFACFLCDGIFEERAIPALAVIGDVNNDGKINATDARLALRAASKIEVLTDVAVTAADVNADGRITALDARAILRHSAKIEFIS